MLYFLCGGTSGVKRTFFCIRRHLSFDLSTEWTTIKFGATRLKIAGKRMCRKLSSVWLVHIHSWELTICTRLKSMQGWPAINCISISLLHVLKKRRYFKTGSRPRQDSFLAGKQADHCPIRWPTATRKISFWAREKLLAAKCSNGQDQNQSLQSWRDVGSFEIESMWNVGVWTCLESTKHRRLYLVNLPECSITQFANDFPYFVRILVLFDEWVIFLGLLIVTTGENSLYVFEESHVHS